MDRSDDVLLRKKFGEEIPSVTELSKHVSMMFVNTHYTLSGAKPLPPTVVELGGVHIQEPKPIDEVIERIFSRSIEFNPPSILGLKTNPRQSRAWYNLC